MEINNLKSAHVLSVGPANEVQPNLCDKKTFIVDSIDNQPFWYLNFRVYQERVYHSTKYLEKITKNASFLTQA